MASPWPRGEREGSGGKGAEVNHADAAGRGLEHADAIPVLQSLDRGRGSRGGRRAGRRPRPPWGPAPPPRAHPHPVASRSRRRLPPRSPPWLRGEVGRRTRVDRDSFKVTGTWWVVEVRAATRSNVGQQWRAGKARSAEGGRRAATDLGR
jgi:hypothetical protein